LIVDGCEPGDDLHEKVILGVGSIAIRAEDLENIPVEIKGILEVSYLIFQLVVLLPEHLFHVHKININKELFIKV